MFEETTWGAVRHCIQTVL